MSAFQSDVGRHSKIALAGIGTCLLAVAYLVYSYVAPPPAATSSVGAIQTSRGAPVSESVHYSEVLEKYNIRNATAATQAGESYLSVFSARPQAVPPATGQASASAPPGPPAANATPAAGMPRPDDSPPAAQPYTPQGRDGRLQQRISEQVQGLMSNWVAVAHSTARVSDISAASPPGGHASNVASAEPPPGAATLTAAAVPLIPGFTLVPASLRTDIDTDENSTVEAHIPAGPYAGAVVYALGYKRWNNSVDMTFTHMAWNGRTYRITAKPVDQRTMRSMLSGEVNNRYVSRILIPALALGLGKAGQLFEQADTQTVISPFGSVIQTRTGSPSGRTIAGAVVGGVATEAGQVLRTDAAQLPVKQVLIPRDETIGVRFIEPVFPTDELKPNPHLQADGSGNVSPVSAAEIATPAGGAGYKSPTFTAQ